MSFRYAASATPALSDFSLKVAPGEFVVLTGPSGCGKTTATRLFNGLIPHFHEGELAGSVEVNGLTPATQQIWETALTVGSVFQNPRSQFFTTDPVSEISFGCENLGFPAQVTTRHVERALRDFHLEPLRQRSIFALSGGEKQRLACAAVAATEPRMYVLDEPSANLDSAATGRLREIMAQWKAEGAAVIVAEHRLGHLADLADRLVVLDEGRIVAEYSGDQFRAMANDDDALTALGLRRVALPSIPPANTPLQGPILEVRDLTYRYSRRHVPGVGAQRQEPALRLERLSLPKGRITALVGTNGSGKTTLARWMAGLSPSSGGQLLDEGREVNRRQRRRRTFLVLQDVNHQLVTESVADEIEMTLRLAGAESPRQTERERILAAVDLEAERDRHPMALSGGQKQRLAVATALASAREIVILDEPTSGLDLGHMCQVARALRRLAAAGRTVVVATHDTELISLCADHVVALADHSPRD